MICPICNTALAEHIDAPCLHAWYAALSGKWVDEPYGVVDWYEYCVEFDDGDWGWRFVPHYTDAEHVWAILVELWKHDELYLGVNMDAEDPDDKGKDMYTVGWYHEWTHPKSKPRWLPDEESTPELAVLKAGILMKSE